LEANVKDANFTLEFSKHVLANSVGPDGQNDRFERDSDNKLIWQQSWWYSAFAKAMQMSKLRGLKPGDICMNLTVEAPTELFARRWGDNKVRTHEAIMPGTRVMFEAVVADHVTESNLQTILTRMGQYVGLSPYGFRLGYGRFSVVNVEVEPSDSAEEEGAVDSETEESSD
jgi:hypothetical protein